MSHTILVIDDDGPNSYLCKVILEARGFEVIIANSATDGMALAIESLPALILMDIQMPGMSGLEATRQLKTVEPLKNVPIIACSAYGSPADEQAARAAGCAAYVHKPFHPKDLAEIVSRVLTKARGPEHTNGDAEQASAC